jgi:hypothetical protein
MTATQMIARVRRLTNTTTNDYSAADLVQDLNSELSMVQINILRDRGVLEFDDANYADMPIATLPVTASQDTYKITEDEDGNKILTIHKVAYQEGDKWVDIPRKTVAEGNQASLTEAGTGKPTSYYEVGNTIVLSPIPSEALTVKVWFDREMSFLTTLDTTKVPGVPTAYHNLVCFRAAYNYALDKGLPNEDRIMRAITMEEEKLAQFEANRRVDEQVVVTVDVISGV